MASDRSVVAVAALALVAAAPRIARADDDHGPLVGLAIGVGAVRGLPSGTYGPGLGRAFIVGYRVGDLELEVQADGSYRLTTRDPVRGANTEGYLTTWAAGLRAVHDVRALELGAFLGAAWAQVPVIAAVDGGGLNPDIEVQDLSGVGAAAAVGIGVRTRRVQLELSANAMLLYWDEPPAQVLLDGDAGGGRSAYHVAGSPLSPIPLALTLTLRTYL